MQAMTEEIQIRQAREDDVGGVLLYLDGLIREHPQTLVLPPSLPTVEEERKWMQKYILPTTSTLLLAFASGRVIGVLEFQGNSGSSDKSRGRFGMSVAADFRNRGVGRALVSGLLDWARANGSIHRVELEVHAVNLAAVALYRNMGFSEVRRRYNAGCVNGIACDILDMAQDVKVGIEPEGPDYDSQARRT
jgi:ribosomal protein S18 acetylase RimI-like enzyme